MTSEDSVCSCSTRLVMNERSLGREHISSTIPIIDRKFLGVTLNNSLNVRYNFRNSVVRLLNTALGGLPHRDLHVQQPQHLSLDRRRRRGYFESRLYRPRRLDPVHRECSELPEHSPEVADGLAGSSALGGRIPPSVR